MVKAMIIGCGRFSGFQDPNNLNYYYGALKKSKIKLVSIYDKDLDISRKISKKFNLDTSNNLKNLYKKYRPEIVIISSTIKAHYTNIKDIIEFKEYIKLLIVEKPFVDKFFKFNVIRNDLISNNIRFIVNHTRRFDKNYLYIKNNFAKLEVPKEIHFKYYGQWINNGIHLIDLIFFLSSDKKYKKFNLSKYRNISILKLYFERGKLITINFEKQDDFNYQVSDFEIFYKKKKVQILNHGETYMYYLAKKNRIGEVELQNNKKLKKIENFPLVNMLKFYDTKSNLIDNLNFLKKNNLMNIYNFFFKLEKYMK